MAQGKGDAAPVQDAPVKPGERAGPGGAQLPGQWAEFGKQRMAGPQGCPLERVLFHRDEMQSRTGRRVPAPALPGGKEVETGAEPYFGDGEGTVSGPPLRQAVAGQEDVPGLGEAVLTGEIHIPVLRRVGGVVEKFDFQRVPVP